MSSPAVSSGTSRPCWNTKPTAPRRTRERSGSNIVLSDPEAPKTATASPRGHDDVDAASAQKSRS